MYQFSDKLVHQGLRYGVSEGTFEAKTVQPKLDIRTLVLYLHFGVSPVLEERADQGLVAVLGRHVDRRLPAVVGEVDVCAVVEQRFAAMKSA